jgi:hypothetical protein
MKMEKRFLLLAFDSFSAISAGFLTLLAASFILALYKWPQEFTFYMGLTNIGYGFYSGFLAILIRKKGFLRRWMVFHGKRK